MSNPYAAVNGHVQRVSAVQAAIRARPEGVKLTIRKAEIGKSHTPHSKSYKASSHPVNVSALTHVLHIDESEHTVLVEGACTMSSLFDACFKRGLMPAVVPEITDFTVAGLINGLGVESSSHRHGPFTTNVMSMEVAIADGSLVVATPYNEYADLYRCMMGSFGSLGVVTAATLKLVPVRPYVRTEYFLYTDWSTYVKALGAAVQHGSDQPDFVEGLVFDEDCSVLMVSFWADEPLDSDHFNPFADGGPYTYQHALEYAKRGAEGHGGTPAGGTIASRLPMGSPAPGQDTMTLHDYIFRHERGWLWTLEALSGASALVRSSLGRRLLDRLARREYSKMDNVMTFSGGSRNPKWTAMDMERCFVQQDTLWRLDRLEHGLQWIQQNLGVMPLWLCPAYVSNDSAQHGPFTCATNFGMDAFLVDVGVYGEPMARGFAPRRSIRALQREVDLPTSFGNVFLSPAEFAQAFDMPQYEAARVKYGASVAFRHIQEKVCVYDEAAPIEGKLSLWRLRRAGVYTPLKTAVIVGGITAAVAGLLWARGQAQTAHASSSSAIVTVGRAVDGVLRSFGW